MLHNHRLDENRLWLFVPSTEKYSCFPVFTETGPFFFGNLETISVPSMSRVYVVGGTGFKKQPEFSNTPVSEELSKYQRKEEPDTLIEESDEPIDLSKETLYARAEKVSEYMAPVDLVGYIDLLPIRKEKEMKPGEEIKLIFTTGSCEQLSKPRTNHAMVFLDPHIYIIGGIEDNTPVSTCKRFDVVHELWGDMASIGFQTNLTSPAVIGFENSVYVFDCYSEKQQIHRYQAEFDLWINIPFNTPGFTIPKSLNSTAFKFDSNQILLINGYTESKDLSAFYYVYDIEKEVFVQERSDRKLMPTEKDRQGNRDYSASGKFFCQLKEGAVKVFHGKNFYWDILPLHLYRIWKQKLTVKGVCCGGKA